MFNSLVQYAGTSWGKCGGEKERTGSAGNAQPSPAAEADRPLKEVDFVVFDTELTGLKAGKDSIVSIGAVKMRGERILLGETFYRVALPRTTLTAKTVLIHEITPTEAAEAPGMDTLLPELLDFLGDAVIVGHVVSIDLQFLNREMKEQYGKSKTLQNPALDTYRLYQWISEKEDDRCAYHGGSPESADLFTLAKKYRIPVQRAHNALGDAFITAQLFQRLLHTLPRWGGNTVKDLLRIGSP